ncbi:unnamed protein product [Caenorhabditis angaria]|uniref:Protein kinase domain-containing protein n=1 Tax=Caenorhabditis angaria TaxID=860376 RepID=A0A9P1I6C1_9PELO|nr:unnamed protein product [Caenorhabditis angaria]
METCLDVTNIVQGTIISKWKIEKKLTQGDFCHIYKVSGAAKSEKFALKCENVDLSLQMLKVESFVIQNLKACKKKRHFCEIEDIGKTQGIHYIVMQLLGRPLVDYMKFGQISQNCALLVGIQIYENRGELNKLFLLSFSIARKYLDEKGQIRSARDSVEFRGTLRYASLNCHKLVELSRKDDLESTFYVIIEMITGNLPWKGFNADQNAVFLAKNAARSGAKLQEFLKNAQFLRELLQIIDNLTYFSTPDYQQIYTILRKNLRNSQEKRLDWEKGGTLFLEDL